VLSKNGYPKTDNPLNRFSTSLVIREMQIKTRMRCQHSSARRAKIKHPVLPRMQGSMGPSYSAGETWFHHFGKLLTVSENPQ
jgi:hypothetical protein